jgi:hypothetical protein
MVKKAAIWCCGPSGSAERRFDPHEPHRHDCPPSTPSPDPLQSWPAPDRKSHLRCRGDGDSSGTGAVALTAAFSVDPVVAGRLFPDPAAFAHHFVSWIAATLTAPSSTARSGPLRRNRRHAEGSHAQRDGREHQAGIRHRGLHSGQIARRLDKEASVAPSDQQSRVAHTARPARA